MNAIFTRLGPVYSCKANRIKIYSFYELHKILHRSHIDIKKYKSRVTRNGLTNKVV